MAAAADNSSSGRHFNFCWATCNSGDKDLRKQQIRNMTDMMCALANSGGGVLFLTRKPWEYDRTKVDHLYDEDIRAFEEKLGAAVPPIVTQQYLIREYVLEKSEERSGYRYELHNSQSTVLSITVATRSDYTVHIPNHHLHLKVPRDMSVVTANECDLKNVLKKEHLPGAYEQIPDPQQLLNRDTPQESRTLQFKGYYEDDSDIVTGVEKKLGPYLSAFASFWGGSVIFGVKEDKSAKTTLPGVRIGENLQGKIRDIKSAVERVVSCLWIAKSKYRIKEGRDYSVTFLDAEPESTIKKLVAVSIRSMRSECQGVYELKPKPETCREETGSFKLVPMSFEDWSGRVLKKDGDQFRIVSKLPPSPPENCQRTSEARETISCFYSDKDAWATKVLVPWLEGQRDLTIAYNRLPGGFIPKTIAQDIERSDKVIIVLSFEYLRESMSENTINQAIVIANKTKKPIVIPIRIDNSDVPLELCHIHTLDGDAEDFWKILANTV